MSNGAYDVVIIGGGPGGSSAGTFAAKAGLKAVIIEKEIFPRFHIGESLLPYNKKIFEEMGVLETMEAQGFPKKYGAQFYIANGSKTLKFVFANGIFTKHTETFQVERAHFDHLLLKHAGSRGVEVNEGWTVQKFESNAEGVKVWATNGAGEKREFAGKFLIDASGRGNFTGNQEGTRVIHPKLKKLAVFGHFTGVRLDEGRTGGDTIIVRLANKWFWIIPISAAKTSVGCVMDQAEYAALKKSPGEVFEGIWKSSPVMRERMEKARLVNQMQTTSDFSYYNKRYVGQRLLRVGDAAGFMDPIFSAGVFLAMFSGKHAVQAVKEALLVGSEGRPQLARYEKMIRGSMEFYWRMVHQFYTTPFLEVFFEPREKFKLASAVNAALAGELGGGWKIRWRMHCFFLIIKAQAKLGFLPRIKFENPPAEAGGAATTAESVELARS